jgi:hypothetical protein
VQGTVFKCNQYRRERGDLPPFIDFFKFSSYKLSDFRIESGGLIMRQDWDLIETAYLSGEKSYRDLANEFEVSLSTLTKRAGREKWTEKKQIIGSKVAAEIADKIITDKTENYFDAIAEIDWLLMQTKDAIQNPDHARKLPELVSTTLKLIISRNELTPKLVAEDSWDSVDAGWD